MNSLLQNDSMLIGDMSAVGELAQKEEARVLVVSDSHGDSAVLSRIVEAAGQECDAMIFCGDGIGDIAVMMGRAVVDSAFRQKLPPVIGIVEGNNDADSYPVRNPLSDSPEYLNISVPVAKTLDVAGHRIFFSHGHRYGLYCGIDILLEAAGNLGADVVLFGHTHVSFNTLLPGNVLAVNPGSCSRSRNQDPDSYAILELKKDKMFRNAVLYGALDSKPFFPSLKYFSF